MPFASQHSNHRLLRRTLVSETVARRAGSFHARSPQFGGGPGGDRLKEIGDKIGDRIGDRIGEKYGGGAEDAFNRWRERVGGGKDNDAPPRRPDRGPPVPEAPVVRPNPEPPAPAAPSPTPSPPTAPPPTGPNNGQPANGGANLGPGEGSNNNNGGTDVRGNQSTTASPVTSAASRGTGLALPVPASLASPSPSGQALHSSFNSRPSSLATAPTTATTGPVDGNGADAGANSTGGLSKKGISGPIIAVIVILSLLFFVVLLVVLLRRRWIARRSERFGSWWVNRRQNSRTYGDYPNEKEGPLDWNNDNFVVNSSERSASPLDLTNIVPTAPPTAEVRRLRNGSDAHLINPAPSERFSSDSFVVNHSTLLSRRMSGTESFKFPKPPSHSDLATAASIHSRLGSSASHSGAASVTAACGHTPFNQSHPSLLVSQPPLTPPSFQRKPSDEAIPNPFADTEGSESLHNPFADGSISIEPLPLGVGDLSHTERIRRPFLPTMADELDVAVDEEVRILQIFDDGWALVEKLEPVSKQGLIPLACLRDIGQGLTSLLNTRRVQSIHVSEHITE